MRLTVKQNEIQPIGLNKQKKIIIDRLYNKENKTDLNPQTIPPANYKHRALEKENNKQVVHKFQAHTKKQYIQQLNMKAELQSVNKEWPSKMNKLLTNNSSGSETDKNNESMLLTCSKGQQVNHTLQYSKYLQQNKFGQMLRKSQDLASMFENLKTNYGPVSRPQNHRRVERSLFAELYEFQSRMKKSNELVQTANFNYRKSNNWIKSTNNQQMLNKKSKSNQTEQQIALMTFNFNKANQNNYQNQSQLDKIKQSGKLSKNQNYWSRDGQVNKQLQFLKYELQTRIQVNRRSKTEASLLLKPKQSNYLFHHYPQENNIYLARDQQPIRNTGPSNRYLRPAPRVNTQRSSQETYRPVGCIRRQNSHQDLFCLQNSHGQSLGTRGQQVSQSNERLSRIRQQLHEIYNNHRQTTNNAYTSKNINNRSQYSLPKNQMIVNTKVMDKSMNNSRKILESQYGVGKINRGRSEVGNQNYRLLLQRPKDKPKV